MIRDDYLPLARPSIGREEIDAVSEVVKSGWWTTGPRTLEFEEKIAEYLQEKTPLYAAAVNSCSAAMFLALKALGIQPGDEVIVPTWTFSATAQVVEWMGARPVLCDIEGESLNIDVEKAEMLITDRTRAIIPVHMAGFPCDMEGILELAEKNGLKVVEDAAHAMGTRYKGTRIGNFSHVTCFSFYATKNMAMGEGGAAVSRDAGLVEKIAKLAYFGINKEAHKRYDKMGTWFYDIECLGYKCNLDSMHAALGLVQLEKLDKMNRRRRDIARLYKEGLSSRITFTKDSENHYHTYHLFPILLPETMDRNGFIQGMKECNIGTGVHFIPLHKHTAYRKRFRGESFPTADRIYERIVSIPMFPAMTHGDVEYVIFHVNRMVEHAAGSKS